MPHLIHRRDFLKAAGAAFAASLAPRQATALARTEALYGTAFQRHDGAYGAGLFAEDGRLVFEIALPERGHDVTFDPVSRRSVVFARRPGTFAIVFDHAARHQPLTITSEPGRHFFGHGLFSPDGRLLYATENDFENAEGRVGVYDATDGFRRIGEFATGGMDPHEMLLSADGRTLVVANGGIETHPDFGRAKLNIATMKPSIVFIDRETGTIREHQTLPPALHQLSIRHMADDGTGRFWFGCQYEGPEADRPALVGIARPGEPPELVDLPSETLGTLRNYVGSIAANTDTGVVAVASPQGNSLVVIDSRSRKIAAVTPLLEVCGIAPDGDGFMASTGLGRVAPPAGPPCDQPDIVWDNHLLRII